MTTSYPKGYEWQPKINLRCPVCGVFRVNTDMEYNKDTHQFECKEHWEWDFVKRLQKYVDERNKT